MPLNPFKFVDSGLLIVSRFPIEKVGQVKYSSLMDLDRLADKAALFVTVDIPTTSGIPGMCIDRRVCKLILEQKR